jgi:hypothetical protein
VSDVNRDVPPPTTTPSSKAATAATRGRQPIAYQSVPRDGGAVIDIDPQSGGVVIRVSYRYNRPWGLVIGFGIVALVPTAKIVYDVLVHKHSTMAPGLIAAAVLFALLALAAGLFGAGPPLHVIANAHELRVRGGPVNEDLDWRRDEVLAVTAEDLEQPAGRPPRISIVIEVRNDEYVTFPVATKQEQAAIVEALRGALKLPPPNASETRG